MSEKDLRPTRYLLTIRYTSEFVTEFFEQNPISQLGIIGMRDGLAVRVSDMGGNPSEHIAKLQGLREQEPKGHASLQNALEMGRAALLYVHPFSICFSFLSIYTLRRIPYSCITVNQLPPSPQFTYTAQQIY